MSKDRLSLDETIKQLDKRKRNLTVEQIKEHLDNIEHCASLYNSPYATQAHANSLAYSKQLILDNFKELKDKHS